MIDKGIISFLSPDPGDEIEGNRKTLEAQEKYPGKLFGSIWINPLTPKWPKEAAKYARRFKAIKIHPELNSFIVNQENLSPVFNFATKYQLPITTHSGGDKSHPEMFIPLLKKYPRVNLVIAHMDPFAKAIKIAKNYSNAYLDTSCVDTTNIKKAVNLCGMSKILYGSDYPTIKEFAVNGPELTIRYENFLQRTFLETNLKDNIRNAIFYKNARKIFNL